MTEIQWQKLLTLKLCNINPTCILCSSVNFSTVLCTALWTKFCTVLLTPFFPVQLCEPYSVQLLNLLLHGSINPIIFCAALRTGQEVEKVQVFPRRDLDEHHLPGQLYTAGDALPVPEELCGLPGEAARLRDGRRPRLPVQLRLLSTNGNNFLYRTNIYAL